MNRLVPLVVALALAAPLSASAYDLVQNGGFETTSLSGWTPFSQGASGGTGSWYAKSTGNGQYSGLPISPPPAGSWEAVADNNGRVAAILYQDITIPATTKATLSFIIWHGNAAPGNVWTNGSSLNPSTTNQRVRVDIVSTSQGNLITSGALALIYQTATGTPNIVNPTTITTDVTAFAGQTVRLRFALVATQGGLIAGIDQVKLEVSPFSLHPATFPAMYSTDAHWADIDGDGQYEVVVAGYLEGQGRITLVERYTGGVWQSWFGLQAASWEVAPGDVDGDGDIDIGIQGYSYAGQNYVVVLNNWMGNMVQTLETIGASNGTIAWGDMDSDGDLDALLTGLYNGEATTYIGRNDGTGHLTWWYPFIRGISDGDAVWANVHAAGIRDIVTIGVGFSGGLTDFSPGDGNGNFTTGYSQFIDMATGKVAMGDFNNDGVDEMVLVGRKISDNARASKIYGLGMFGWLETMSGLDAVDNGAVAVGDVDNDGFLDIALMGQTGSGQITRIYRNNGNGTFTDMALSLPGLENGSLAFADFEGDGDLDLLMQGQDNSTSHSWVAINGFSTINLPPSAPSNLFTQLGDTEITLNVGFGGTDDHAPGGALTRNFRAGTSPGTCNLIPPMSNLTTGRRLVAQPGEAGHAYEAKLAINRIGHNYGIWWAAQSVDLCYLGSAWSGETLFPIGPTIQSVADIKNDQGGHVRLTVTKSPLDDENRYSWPAAGYNLWRLVPPGSVATAVEREGVAMEAEVDAGDLPIVQWKGRRFARSPGLNVVSPFPAGTWEIVGSWFANQQSSYVIATTTIADSGAGGMNDQTYMVTMHTTTPSVWFASLPVSGHSVDNLAPAPPVGLAANYHTGSGNHLGWQPAPEPDFESFRVYRGTTAGFVASPANLVASVPNPSWTDPSYDSPLAFYKVSTTDHAGNESAAVEPGSTTAVEEPGAELALRFALQAPSPNPFGEATTIGFTLPRGGNARLEVFDASGRRVRTLVSGWQPAGERVVRWAGEDDEGGRVKAGVYFCRLEAGELRAVRRVARMR